MSLNVINCSRCGKLCVRNVSEMCPACMKDLEYQYELCLNHLRENRGITLQELSDATEVPIKQIIRYIREGRISVVNAPNLSYPCEVCGIPIREHAICPSCRQRLAKEVSQLQDDQKRAETAAMEDRGFQIQDRLKKR